MQAIIQLTDPDRGEETDKSTRIHPKNRWSRPLDLREVTGAYAILPGHA